MPPRPYRRHRSAHTFEPVPRPLRLQVAGGVFHVTARGNRRQPIFTTDRDRAYFLALLRVICGRLGWRCHAYCLMTNHYHLLIETPNGDLSKGLHWLNFRYAQWFNLQHEYSGHLFQGRFHSVLVESNVHLIELARYIVLNPVRGGLCARPQDWRWSSYRVFAHSHVRPTFVHVDWLLGQFGRDAERARTRYRQFVEEGIPRSIAAAAFAAGSGA
jgi:REP element-mobilizing transposase RayT